MLGFRQAFNYKLSLNTRTIWSFTIILKNHIMIQCYNPRNNKASSYFHWTRLFYIAKHQILEVQIK